MHIVVGEISAHYSGRSDTILSPYNRIVVYKHDGSVSIHGDKGYKPMNYMTATNEMIESINDSGEKVWTFMGKKEQLVVTFHSIHDEIFLELGMDDPGYSQRNGNEAQLQKWLSENIHVIGSNLEFVEREHQTGDGPVDLLAKHGDILYPIEVKRTAPTNTVGQIIRYVDAMREHNPGVEIKGIIAAVDFKDKTLEIAAKKDVQCVKIPENWFEISSGDAQLPDKFVKITESIEKGEEVLKTIALKTEEKLKDLFDDSGMK